MLSLRPGKRGKRYGLAQVSGGVIRWPTMADHHHQTAPASARAAVCPPRCHRARGRGHRPPGAAVWLLLGLSWLAVTTVATVAPPPLLAQRNGQEALILIDRPSADFELRWEGFDTRTETTRQSFGFWFEELTLRSGFSLFHPRFIDVDLSLGGVFSQGQGDRSGDDREITTWSVTTNLLREHPYSLQYSTSRRRSTTSISATQAANSVLTTRRTQLSLSEQLGLPFPLRLQYQTRELLSTNVTVTAEGTPAPNSLSRAADRWESAAVSSTRRWGRHFLNWSYEEGHRDYRQETVIQVATSEYDFTRYNLRAGTSRTRDSSFFWNLTGSGRSQTDAPEFSADRANANVGGDLYESWVQTLSGKLRASGSRREQALSAATPGAETVLESTETRSAGAELAHRLYRSLHTTVGVNRSTTQSSGATSQTDGYGFGVRYTKRIPGGRVYATYDIDKAETESKGVELQRVTGEEHTVSGITPLQLDQPNVVLTTTERPVVTDISGTIVYVEDFGGVASPDYRVFQVGRDTFIEPLATGSIPDGPILVSYLFERPRAELRKQTESYTVGGEWRWFEPYLRVTKREEVDESLDPTASDLLLNPGSVRIYGILYRQIIGIFEPVVQLENESNRLFLDPLERQQRDATVRIHAGVGMTASVYRNATAIDHVAPDRPDSRTTTLGADMVLAQGRYRIDLGASQQERLQGSVSNEVFITDARLVVGYGRWVLEAQISSATERSKDQAIPGSGTRRETVRTLLGLKARF